MLSVKSRSLNIGPRLSSCIHCYRVLRTAILAELDFSRNSDINLTPFLHSHYSEHQGQRLLCNDYVADNCKQVSGALVNTLAQVRI
jgi:hypothetical protein